MSKHDSIQEYYGETLTQSQDLQTNACCTLTPPPEHIKQALANIHDEVICKYYGCGLTIPNAVTGMKILDLGSGSGRDCYIASQLVGERGSVVGVDMTDAQLQVAMDHLDHHRRKFGFAKSNVHFIKGNIEELDQLPLEKGSFDIIISNCVINLAQNKEKVLQDAYDLLKPGGEMYFSDVYADRRIPVALQNHPTLWNECLSGAMYWNDFLNTSKRAGFTDPRVVESHPITVENPELQKLTGSIGFHSVTYRLWKIENLESDCEDYGQAIKYKGTIPFVPHAFTLDDHHVFETGKMYEVCGNTFSMLHDTRFHEHFEFFGDRSTHYGIFEGCGGNAPFNNDQSSSEASCC